MKRNRRSVITKKTCDIHFPRQKGTWYSLDSGNYPEGTIYLMESVEYGKAKPRLLVNEHGDILASGCCNSLEIEYEAMLKNNS